VVGRIPACLFVQAKVHEVTFASEAQPKAMEITANELNWTD
jgi:hypothetical protein